MAEKIKILVYPAKDLKAGKSFFNTFLGVEPYVDSVYYVGYKIEGLEIGLDPNGKATIAYIDVQDIKKSLQSLLDSGANIYQDISEVGGGLLIAQVKDKNGNVLGLRQQT
jgi:predicted enzyme related to lactoylglutathione lyase